MYLADKTNHAVWGRRRILFTILLTSFVVETGAMFLLPVLLPSDVNPWIEALCDASLLSLVSLPLLWFLLIQPMYASHCEDARRAQMLGVALDEHALVSATDARGRIIYANDAFCRISKYPREALLGKDHRILNSGYHPKPFMKDLWATIKRGEAWQGEIRNRAADGSFYWVHATIVPFTDLDGKIQQYAAIRVDITELKRAEEQSERYADELEAQKEELEAQHHEIIDINASLEEACQKSENATRAKSEFLANMSHEIRTPMTAILGFSENLLDKDLSESERLNCVHTIRRNGEYLLGLINDILDLSKIEADKMTVERMTCQPCAIVAEVAALMRVRADAKGLVFKVEYIGAIPETIQTDGTRVRQILINLVGNALKFTEVGSVRLVTRFVEGAEDAPEGSPKAACVQFDVIDTGKGMAKDHAAKLFQPFMQGDSSTTRQFGGTGLGLTISKRFAALLGGDVILAATESGVGSTFRATVATGAIEGVRMLEDPMSATAVSREVNDSTEAAESGLNGSRVLLAEDGPDNQRLLSFVLKKAGAEVVVKENGQLAMDAALAARDEGHSFDAILMDMQMPVMDGYAATEQLRQHGYTGPIIALTAHAMAADREKCIQAGCDDYASKPIDRKSLIETIQRHRRSAEPAATMVP